MNLIRFVWTQIFAVYYVNHIRILTQQNLRTHIFGMKHIVPAFYELHNVVSSLRKCFR